MTYLDTGCFVKLYYPEPDSAKVIALIQGKPICYTPFHELEFVKALQSKVFLKNATASQVTAARALVETDLKTGVLVSPSGEWKDILCGIGEACGTAHRNHRLSVVGHFTLRSGEDFGCQRIYFHGRATEEAGRGDEVELGDVLSSRPWLLSANGPSLEIILAGHDGLDCVPALATIAPFI